MAFPSMRRVVWASIVLLEWVVIHTYPADFKHFTWWLHALFTVYAILGTVGAEMDYYVTFQLVNILVILSVVRMSRSPLSLPLPV